MTDNTYNSNVFILGVQYGSQREIQRVLQIIKDLEAQSHKTRTPLYQETIFETLRERVNHNG